MTLVWTILKPFAALIAQAFAVAFFDWLRERRDVADAKAAGRAEAEADAAKVHADAVDRMARVPTPGDDEAVEILRRGEA